MIKSNLPILSSWVKYERKIRKAVYKSLRSQATYLKNNLKDIYAKPVLRVWLRWKAVDNMNDFFTNMWIYAIEDEIYQDIKSVILSGYRWRARINKQDLQNFWIEFNKNNPAIMDYMDEWSKLQLSDYKGSIAWTTKRAVIEELQNWFKWGLSYTEIAKNINKLDDTIFSLYRAKMIAVNETRKAFEYWNALPMSEIYKQWWMVVKLRQNMHDSKVSQQCVDDNEAGWIDFQKPFPSWNMTPPWHVNCRCHCQYQLL